MIKVSISKVQIAFINYRIKISIFIKRQVTFNIHFEILEQKLYRAVIRQKPKVDMLVSCNFPMFDRREMDIQQGFI
jgi:hypothetical protein